MSLCTVWHLPVLCRATARAQLQQSQPQTAWAEWLLNLLYPLCVSETQLSSSPSALLCPSTMLGAESHSARSQKGGREMPTPNWPKCSGMAGHTYLAALWQMQCPCGMAGLRGTSCRCTRHHLLWVAVSWQQKVTGQPSLPASPMVPKRETEAALQLPGFLLHCHDTPPVLDPCCWALWRAAELCDTLSL